MNHGQILKTRDDRKPVLLEKEGGGDRQGRMYTLAEGASCDWVDTGESIDCSKLRSRIEPWLTALVQSENLSLLAGSGLTNAVHIMATESAAAGMGTVEFPEHQDEVSAEVKRAAAAAGREEGNVEDQIRVGNELLRGLEILTSNEDEDNEQKQRTETLRASLKSLLNDFADSILRTESNLAKAESEKRHRAFEYLVSFLMSFASRSVTRERLNLFTTNYDRCIEAGADVAGLRLIDRFVGTLAPVFRASRLDVDMHYNPPGIRGDPHYLEGVARFTKLHGSVDWLDTEQTIKRIGLPFGAEEIAPYLKAPGLDGSDASRLMIYPNSAKDRETAAHPYVELFRDFAAAVCRPNSTVVCYGYSFGDEHINRVIEDLLTIPSTHLVVISHDDPLGRIMKTYEKLGRSAQVTLLIGDHLGNLQALVDHYLPKPAIDRTTFRMAEILKNRLGTEEPPPAKQGQESPTTPPTPPPMQSGAR